jgi:hypothetical protein
MGTVSDPALAVLVGLTTPVLLFRLVPLEGPESWIFKAAVGSTLVSWSFFSLARARMVVHSSGETVLILSAPEETNKAGKKRCKARKRRSNQKQQKLKALTQVRNKAREIKKRKTI